MITLDDIRVEQVETHVTGTLGPRQMMFVAHGPDGHAWLLKRFTAEDARRDGLAYFLSTRVLHDGRWYIADEHGRPFCDARGTRFNAQRRAGVSS